VSRLRSGVAAARENRLACACKASQRTRVKQVGNGIGSASIPVGCRTCWLLLRDLLRSLRQSKHHALKCPEKSDRVCLPYEISIRVGSTNKMHRKFLCSFDVTRPWCFRSQYYRYEKEISTRSKQVLVIDDSVVKKIYRSHK
jgi:hypothetical protein